MTNFRFVCYYLLLFPLITKKSHRNIWHHLMMFYWKREYHILKTTSNMQWWTRDLSSMFFTSGENWERLQHLLWTWTEWSRNGKLSHFGIWSLSVFLLNVPCFCLLGSEWLTFVFPQTCHQPGFSSNTTCRKFLWDCKQWYLHNRANVERGSFTNDKCVQTVWKKMTQ